MKLKRCNYPEFKVLCCKSRDEAIHSVMESELGAIFYTERMIWVATPDPTGDAICIDSSQAFPFSEDGYEEAKRCYEERLLRKLKKMKNLIEQYTE